MIDPVPVEDCRRRGRLQPRLGCDPGMLRGQPVRLRDQPQGGRRRPVEGRGGEGRIHRRRPRRIEPHRLVDRRHRFGDGCRAIERCILDMDDVVAVPGNVPAEILLDPTPLPLRVDGHDVGAMQRAVNHHVAVDDGKDLQLSPDAVPEHAVGHASFRCSQHAAGTVDRAERGSLAFAGRSGFRPDRIAAGMADRFDTHSAWHLWHGREKNRPPGGHRSHAPGPGVGDDRRRAGPAGVVGENRLPIGGRRRRGCGRCQRRRREARGFKSRIDQRQQRRIDLRVGGLEPPGDLVIGGERLERHLSVATREEHARQGVVVFVRNRVELMVVAAGAAERQAEKRLSEGVDAIVGAISLVLRQVGGRLHLLTQIPEAGAHHRLVRSGRRIDPRLGKQISGNLLPNKLIVGQIVVERPHRPIAILSGIGKRVVDVVAAGLAVADDVEPMPRKSFAVVRRGEQVIDIDFEGMGIGIGSHLLHVGRIGGQPGQQFGRPPHQHGPRCFRSRREPSGLQPMKHKRIDEGVTPVCVPDGRGGDRPRRLPAPVRRLAFLQIECLDLKSRLAIVRPRQPATDPLLNRVNRRIGESAVGRHLQVAVVPHHRHEQAVVGPTGHGDPAGRQKISPRIERQTTLGVAGLARMAFGAVLEQERAHLRLEEVAILGEERICGGALAYGTKRAPCHHAGHQITRAHHRSRFRRRR